MRAAALLSEQAPSEETAVDTAEAAVGRDMRGRRARSAGKGRA
ncbi:hypothetical protein [Streptomyces shenzhenensis]